MAGAASLLAADSADLLREVPRRGAHGGGGVLRWAYASQDFECPADQVTVTDLASPATPKRNPQSSAAGSVYAWKAAGCGKTGTYVQTNTSRFVALPDDAECTSTPTPAPAATDTNYCNAVDASTCLRHR